MSVNVIHVIDSLAPGGAERVLVELTNELFRKEINISVCVTRSDTSLKTDLNSGIKLLVLSRRKTWDWQAIHKFLDYCQENRIQILHVHGRSSLLFCSLAKFLSGNSLKIVFHDHFGEIRVNQLVTPPLRFVIRNFVDRYIAVDPILQAWVVHKVGISKEITSVVRNAINPYRFIGCKTYNNSLKASIKQPILGVVVANLRPQKDHKLLFRALALSDVVRKNLHVLLVGWEKDDQYSKECRDMVHSLNLEGNITFLGSRLDIPELLSEGDLGLLSSISESGPVTLIEYMAAGLPFVVTNTGYITELIKNKLDSFCFVDPGNVFAYSQALERIVLMSGEERIILGARYRELVIELFGVEQQANTILQIYEQIKSKPLKCITFNKIDFFGMNEK